MTLIRLVPALVLAILVTACGKPETTAVEPLAIQSGTACSLDGMILADFPGPKAQIHYASGEPDFFCDTMEMFSIYLQPEQQKRITGIFTQDMAKENWDKPEGHWIDAKQAWFVVGSSRQGSMGHTIASFAERADADAFATQYGGKVYAFSEITPDIADLTGGANHDEHM
ncbi:MAG: nitrous oxide reductase accessory protein NosL [Methylobacillus sp.]|nr:nitrous oxide reductase accessory protein NosL [Methylobacillus sp.]